MMMETAYGRLRPAPAESYEAMDADTREYWDLEAVYFALEARRHGSLYRKALRVPWWRKVWWELTPLPGRELIDAA